LCEPEMLLNTLRDPNDSSANKVIIEFGNEYTNGEKVEYVLNVKPGEFINDKTILAYIKQDGKMKPIRSIFSEGYVKETENHDYYHVYPSACRDHIILMDVSGGVGMDFDSMDVSIYSKRMSGNGELYSFIMNNAVYSLLPNLISNSTPLLVGFVGSRFNSQIENYNNKIAEFSNSFETISSSDNIE